MLLVGPGRFTNPVEEICVFGKYGWGAADEEALVLCCGASEVTPS